MEDVSAGFGVQQCVTFSEPEVDISLYTKQGIDPLTKFVENRHVMKYMILDSMRFGNQGESCPFLPPCDLNLVEPAPPHTHLEP